MKRTTFSVGFSPDHDAVDVIINQSAVSSEDGTDWERLEAMTGEEALQNALDDPDSQPLTPELRAKLRRVPDPRQIRLSMNLTQEAFARRFEIALGTLRDWEQGVRIPDSTAKSYLRVIERDPEAVVKALSYRPERSEEPSGGPA